MSTVIKPKTPKGKGWTQGESMPSSFNMGYGADVWYFLSQNLMVISAVEAPFDPHLEKGPEYHISISKNGKRCS